MVFCTFEQAGEIELGGAGITRGLQVCALPVSGFSREFCEPLAGDLAHPVALVVGEVAGDVSQLGGGTACVRAAAVAVGTQGWLRGKKCLAEGLDPQPDLSPGRALLAHLGADFGRAMARKFA